MASNPPPQVDTSTPHAARVYDYWLGGKDNYAADRTVAEQIKQLAPAVAEMAQANRAVMERLVGAIAGEYGVTQYLDIGTGIPTSPNLHQVAQRIHPASRVLYADNDPLVLAHARALMTGSPEGRTAFVLADFANPSTILESPEFRSTLDLGQPVALTLIAMLMYFDVEENGVDPYAIVAEILDLLPSGSFLAISHPTGDFDPVAAAGISAVARQSGNTVRSRSKAEVARFFDGLDLVDPGLAPVLAWRPKAGEEPADPNAAHYWVGLGRKP